jgi:hypothetical protein
VGRGGSCRLTPSDVSFLLRLRHLRQSMLSDQPIDRA